MKRSKQLGCYQITAFLKNPKFYKHKNSSKLVIMFTTKEVDIRFKNTFKFNNRFLLTGSP